MNFVATHPAQAQSRRPFIHHSLIGGPAVNIRETEEAFFVDIIAPGREKGLFELSVKEGVLGVTINAPTTEHEGEYRQREFTLAQTRKNFRLPKSVDESAITATYEQGILTVKLAKRAEVAPLQIEVQ
ncbi:MAG: Hsp20/alpha crystallin family protein [Bacteroidia bacterium]|nr:Hsp20/alpha crystallin family protein [Bacteroidia bacterium]